MRDKVKNFEILENRIDNMESHKLNFPEFVDTMIKISCFSKLKIASLFIEQVVNVIDDAE